MYKIEFYRMSASVPAGYFDTIEKSAQKAQLYANFIIGFFTLLPFVFFETTPANLVHTAINLSFPYQLGVLYMAFISGTLAYALGIEGQKSIEISEAGLFSYLYPVFSAPLAVFWLGEKITVEFVIGAVLITMGVIIAEFKGLNKDKVK